MHQTDSLGRATFPHIAPQAEVRVTPRDLRWLAHIARHGPQSSIYLHDLTRDTHRCPDTSRRQLQKLRVGGLLCLPAQQRHTAHADFNPYIYDLTERGRYCLRDHGLPVPPVPVRGHWAHRYLTACVTSSIDIAATRDGVRYIPMHEILARNDATLAVPIGRQRLIPDQLFALDYGGSFRAFALEVDRGTEPLSSKAARKSLETSIDLYCQLLDGRYRRHYGLKANLLVLSVFVSRSRLERFLELVAKRAGALCSSFLATSVDKSGPRMLSSKPLCALYESLWFRVTDTISIVRPRMVEETPTPSRLQYANPRLPQF